MNDDQMNLEMKPYKGMKGRGAKKAAPIEAGDLTAVLTLTIDSCKEYRGTQAIYPADQKGLERFIDKSIEYFRYINRINEDPSVTQRLIPDIESWALFMGVTRQTIFRYEQRGGAWAEAITYFKTGITACKKQMAMNSKIPPLFAVFDLVNNSGYLNTSEFKLTTAENAVRPERSQQLETEIAAAGLVWDATSGEYIDKGAV